MPALEDKDQAPTWLVFTPREPSPQYQQYETPSERVRHDPETLVLDVPGRPLPFRWTDEVSLWGVGAGAFAGIGTALSVGAAEAFLAGLGIGVVIDVCRTVWRVARELHERQPQVQLGTTTMSFTDEGFRCTSYNGQEASIYWSDVDRVTVGYAGVGVGSVHVWWRPAGSTEDSVVEIGPGTDLVEIHRALMRHSAPELTYVSETRDAAPGGRLPSGPEGHRAV